MQHDKKFFFFNKKAPATRSVKTKTLSLSSSSTWTISAYTNKQKKREGKANNHYIIFNQPPSTHTHTIMSNNLNAHISQEQHSHSTILCNPLTPSRKKSESTSISNSVYIWLNKHPRAREIFLWMILWSKTKQQHDDGKENDNWNFFS